MSGFSARAGSGLRLVRAAVFAAACVVLSGTGHAFASHGGVPLWASAAGFAAVFGCAAGLAGRERSLPGIAVALGTAQIALHVLFGWAQRAASAPVVTPPSGRAATGADPVVALAGRLLCGEGPEPLSVAEARRVVTAAGIDPASHTAAHAAATPAPAPPGAGAGLHDTVPATLFPSTAMLLAHLLAAVVLGLLLRRGEAALFRLVRLSARGLAEGVSVRSLRAALRLARVLLAGACGAPRPRNPRRSALSRERVGPHTLHLAHSVSRRGPPEFALAA
ncbi:hypothetical protein [Streptomyces zingiberis]|uniref:Integral membrane protein n=1 Tax=Streptomyces zingiberis TaxID=2053010 RepID=A0ABX1BN57_9ACTN|nr:hypothetical protein [Streptomyces zingiberis]NJP99174.1 hypothetical protein [Streptomyces zingiberis]